MFAWLRAPGAGADEWLAVDAYYPRARLVVMCRSRPGPHDSLYRELVPGARARTVDGSTPPCSATTARPSRRRWRGKVLSTSSICLAARDAAIPPHIRDREPPRAATPRARTDAADAPAPRVDARSRSSARPFRGFVQGFGVIAGLAFAALPDRFVGCTLGVISSFAFGARSARARTRPSAARGVVTHVGDGERQERRRPAWLGMRLRDRRSTWSWPGWRSLRTASPDRHRQSSPRRWPGCSRCSPGAVAIVGFVIGS